MQDVLGGVKEKSPLLKRRGSSIPVKTALLKVCKWILVRTDIKKIKDRLRTNIILTEYDAYLQENLNSYLEEIKEQKVK